MRFALLSLLLVLSFTATAMADSYDANQSMDGLTTRIVTSHGTSKVKGWMLSELARQTAANKAAKKVANKAAVKAATKTAAMPKKERALEVETIASNDDDVQQVARGGYQPRSYHSQYYMPYMGHVSVPEHETDYRPDYSDPDYR